MHSSNHGSHVCHKCGWAFPNPHPSAKHRRAHKKVCGKIEGFKENAAAHLSISDDEEDQDKGEETMENVKRQVSNRSEEEEFSDAVAEFVSSGTSSTGAQITVDGDVVEDDLNSSSSADVTEPPGNDHGNKIESPEAFDKLGSKLETDMQSEPSLSSKEATSVLGMTTKSLAPELTKEKNMSTTSLSLIEANVPESPLIEENIQTGENLNPTGLSEPSLTSRESTLDSVITTKPLAPELTKEEIISASSVSPLETTVPESPLIEENIQTSEPSLCSKETTTLVSDMTTKSLAPELAKEKIISATSVSPLETDVTESPLIEEIIQTSENLNPMVQIEENTGTHGKGEVVEIESKVSEIYLDSLKMERFTKGDSQVMTDVSDVNSVTLPADVIMGMEDVCASEQKTFVDDVCASEQKKSQCEVSLSSIGAIEAEVIELEHIDAFVDDAHVKADSDNVNICLEENVNEKNTSIPLPIELPVEERATLNGEDSADPKPAKLEPSSTLDSAEETVEAFGQNLECKEGHYDFLSNKSNETGGISFPAEQAFEDKVSQGGALSKSTVEHAYAEGEHDSSAVSDTSKEHPELNSSEALPETASYDIKSSNTDTNQVICSFVEQELQISRQNLSFEMQPQTTTGVSAGCDVVVSPEDVENSKTNCVVTCKADAVHEENGEKCNMDEISIGEAIEVADLSTDVSDDAVDCKANNVVTFQDDTVHTEGKESEISDIAETCIGATAVEDLSKDRELVPEDDRLYELKPNLQGAITTPLDAFTNSNEKEPLIDSSYVKQVSHGEQFLDGSEESPVIKGGTDSSASEERTVAVIGNAVEPVQIERKLNIGNKVAQINRGSENTKSEESLPSVIDSGPPEPRSSNIEAGAKYFVEGHNTKEGDYPVKQHLEEASPIVPPEGSVDSISQTDSIEGQWGSVSDGTVPSSRYAADTPKPEDHVTDLKGAHMNQFHETAHIAKAPLLVSGEAGREHGLDSSFSEIQAEENQQQMEALALSADAPPSLSHAVLESQGKKKNDDEIIAKVVNWSSDKSRTPLRSLLVEANLESKQKTVSTQSHQNPTTKKDENPSSATGLSGKQVPATKSELPSIYDATKGNPGKEWNSPARLPNTREKRKVRYWVPLCCSSVN